MIILNRAKSALLVGIVSFAFSGAAHAEYLTVPPQPMREAPQMNQPANPPTNDMYISGGIGEDERDQILAMAHQYNLQITNTNQQHAYTADTSVTIHTKAGHEVLRADGTGPLMFVKLPPGEYVLEASNDGQRETRKLKIGAHGTTKVYLVWKQN